MAATFLLNTKAEFLKTKRTAALWLTVIGAMFIPLVNFIRLMAVPEKIIPHMHKDPWTQIIKDNWEVSSIFLLPMFVILVTSLIVQVEYRNNTWKQVYASPRSYVDIFFSRFITIHAMVLLCFVLFNVFILFFSCMAQLFYPAYEFFSHSINWKSLFGTTGKLYFAVISITAIQYWLSLRFKNFIAPLGIGLALLITGLIIHQWERLYLYPYMYPAIEYLTDFSKNPDLIFKAKLFNMIWFVSIVLLAFFDMVKRKERG